MTTVTYTVPAISCGHCTHTIETEVGELQGVQSVKAEIDTKKVLITFDTPGIDGRAPDEIVHSCGSGVSACNNLVAMEYAGLAGSALYPGSWSEWCADPARPVGRAG